MMKLKEYLDVLNALAKSNPKSLEMEVITSSDDEGNSFTPVYYHPQMGIYNAEDREWDVSRSHTKSNSVCLN